MDANGSATATATATTGRFRFGKPRATSPATAPHHRRATRRPQGPGQTPGSRSRYRRTLEQGRAQAWSRRPQEPGATRGQGPGQRRIGVSLRRRRSREPLGWQLRRGGTGPRPARLRSQGRRTKRNPTAPMTTSTTHRATGKGWSLENPRMGSNYRRSWERSVRVSGAWASEASSRTTSAQAAREVRLSAPGLRLFSQAPPALPRGRASPPRPQAV